MAIALIYLQGVLGGTTHRSYDPSGDSYDSALSALATNGGWGTSVTDGTDIIKNWFRNNLCRRYDIADDTWGSYTAMPGINDSEGTASSDDFSDLGLAIFSHSSDYSTTFPVKDCTRLRFATSAWTVMSLCANFTFEGGAFSVGNVHHHCGGTSLAPYVDSHETYDITTDTWASGTVLDAIRARCRGVGVGGAVGYIVKGIGPSGETSTNDRVDPSDDTTDVTTADGTNYAQYAGAAVMDSVVYCFGGDDSGNLDDNRDYTPATDTWAANTAVPAAGQQITCAPATDAMWAGTLSLTVDTTPPTGLLEITLDNTSYPNGDQLDVNLTLGTYLAKKSAADKALAAGGYNVAALSSIQVYDVSGNSWGAGTSFSNTWHSMAAFPADSYGDRTWFCGGVFNGSESKRTDEHRITEDTLTSKTNMPPASSLSLAGSARCNSKGYVFGGWAGGAARATSIYKATLSTEAWATASATLTTARQQCCAATSDEDPDNAFILGGDDSGGASDEVDEYNASGDSITAKTVITATMDDAGCFGTIGMDQVVVITAGVAYSYGINGNSWTALTTTALGGAAPRGYTVDYKVFGFGGETSDDMMEYDWSGDSWVAKTVASTNRGHCGWNCNSVYA